MIKINLALRKSAAVGEKSARGFDIDLEGLKEFPLKKIAVCLLIGFGVSYYVDDFKSQEMAKVMLATQRYQGANSELKKEIDKAKTLEPLKKELETYEAQIKAKVDTIRELMADRSTPPKILANLARTIPSDVWLDEMALTSDEAKFHGSTMEMSHISDFMSSFRLNPYFGDTRLINSSTKRDEFGLEVSTFEFTAKRKPLGGG